MSKFLLLPRFRVFCLAGLAFTFSAVFAQSEIDLESYQLGQGDHIAIQVFDEPDLTMEARIGASGVINYSYLGDIQVTGASPAQLERKITDLLRDGYLVNPSVNICLLYTSPSPRD